MKKYLLPSIIADLFTSAKGYATPATQIAPAGNRFRTFSLKPILVKTALVVFSLFFVNAAFAARRITQINVTAQSVTPTYGNATANITYTITVTSTGTGTTQPENIKITWPAPGLPSGVTTDIPVGGIVFTPNTNNQTLPAFHITTTAASPANAAGWTFTLTSSSNNGGGDNVNGLLKINPKALTITGLSTTGKPYDGGTTATISGTPVLNGVIGADNVGVNGTALGTFNNANAGSRTVTVSGLTLGGTSATNYTFTAPSFTNVVISQVGLSITSNVTKTYGTNLGNSGSTNQITAVGLVGTETIGSVTDTYGTGKAANAAVGTYAGQAAPSAATGGTFTASNYSITYTAGSITVNPFTVNVTLANVTKTYGAPIPTFTATYNTPFPNGESQATVVTTVPSYTTTATQTSDPGTYPITLATNAVVSGNYVIGTYTTGSLTISGAPAVYDWTGALGSNWSTPGNWNVNGIPQTVKSPGPGTADQVRIGVTTGIVVLNQPTLTGANLGHTLASITFGNVNGSTTLTVDVGRTLNTTNLTVNANTTANLVDNGTAVGVTNNYVDASTSVFNVSGTAGLSITSPNDLSINGAMNQQGGGALAINVSGNNDITINSTGSVTQTAASTGTVALTSSGGNINISGSLIQSGASTFKATANGDININNSGIVTQSSTIGTSTLSLITSTNSGGVFTNNGHLNLQGAGNVTVTADGYFQNQNTILQSGSGTMTLFGGNGTILSLIGVSGVYNNATITQSGSGTMTFTSAFHNNQYPFSATIPVFTQSGAGIINFNSTFDNGANVIIFNLTGGPVTFGNAPSTVNFKNNFTITSGTVTFGTGLATFNGATTAASNITIPANTSLTLVNCFFTNAVTHSFNTNGGGGATASYIIRSDGVMTLSSNTTLDFADTQTLTLNSDGNSSATIAALASPTQIKNLTNKAIVQRFIKGSADLSKRGYRLITSTVYTATTGGSNVFDLNYLTSMFTSGFGFAANGFSVPTTSNPSIYLFREDDPPPPALTTIFTTGYNWKGVAKINNSPLYNIGTQAKNTTINTLDATYTIPVGNGLLYYFRGAGTTNINNYSVPFAAPADATLAETGTLNTGTIPVKLWYANDAGLGNNLSYTVDAAHTSAPTGSLTSGFNLVGNPYPSTINWETYKNGGITGSVTGTIYVFNEFDKQYEAYIQLNDGDLTSEHTSEDIGNSNAIGAASNFIASGQAFFVQASGPGQNLTFNETAKISAQPTVANFTKLMGKPKATAATPTPFLHLKMITDSLNYDEVIIRFKDNSSGNFVKGEDAVDMGGSDALESLSVFSADSIKLAISTMPLPGLKPSVVHLFTGAPTTGTYSLNVKGFGNMPNLYKVWLKDGFTKDSVDLRKTTTYSFTIDKANAATFGANRFTVVFGQDTANAYHLLNFDAQKVANEQKVQTVWKTKNEQNYTTFTVERSTDEGNTFNVVGGLQGTGAGTYSLIDKNPSKGDNVYRLKQEDVNNVITYSNLVNVFFGTDKKIHLYPNPAVNVINVDVRERWHDKDKYEIVVTNSAGTVVKRGTSGDSQWQAHISNLHPGTYLVSVLSKDDKNLVGQAKFVKL